MAIMARPVGARTGGGGGGTVLSNITGMSDFIPSEIFAKHMCIIHGGKLWRAKENFVSSTAFDALDWEPVDFQVTSTGYTIGSAYAKYALVLIGTELFSAKENISVASDPIDRTKWTLLNPSSPAILDYAGTSSYLEGGLVRFNDLIYSARIAIPIAPPVFQPKYWRCLEKGTFKVNADFDIHTSGHYEMSTASGDITIKVVKDTDPLLQFKEDFVVGDGSESFTVNNKCIIDFSDFTYPMTHAVVAKQGTNVGLAELRVAGDYFKFFWVEAEGTWYAKDLRSGITREV